MKFHAIPINQAQGMILGHNIAGENGRRVLRKGHALTAADIDTLHALQRETVYVAELDADDVDENSAAQRIAKAVLGTGQGASVIRCSNAATGRVNLFADLPGLVRVNVPHLNQLNTCVGVTLATVYSNTPVRAGKMIATLKIIPYALSQTVVETAEALGQMDAPLLALTPFQPKRVGLILSGSVSAQDRIVNSFKNALTLRLDQLAATIEQIDFVPLNYESGERQLADTLRQQIATNFDLIILAGETAIMDRYDIAPRAVERADGEVVCFGAPVDPGNLLMLGYHGDTPILGAPGCSRSPKENIIDLVLPRLLVGDRLTHQDIIEMGHGGLLEDVPERPLPRSRVG
ncbi:MAG: molybdopterin-binding protein [Chloroflexota bacterium]